MIRILSLVLFAAGPACADCPASPDISGDLNTLIAEARSAESDAEGSLISDKMWQLWLTAPDQAAQEMLDLGMRQRQSYDFLGALASYSALVEYCPEYAEGYNQRAFVSFLTGDFRKALVDLDKALSLSPNHVGAQSGRALTLMNLGEKERARKQLLEALENNPWLSERFLLSDGGPLALDVQEL